MSFVIPEKVIPHFMAQITALGQRILNTVNTQLIPWVHEDANFILLDAPPRIIGSSRITEHPGSKLPMKRGIGVEIRVQQWPEEGLSANAAPYMGCLVEGEADIITGTTTAMCRKLKIPGKRWIINATPKTFFLAPPQTPLSNGRSPHWHQANPENAYSRILWLQFHANGINCHFCTTDAGKHWSHPYYFVYGPEFFPLAQTLIHEMTIQALQYKPLVYSTLNTLFHYMVRSLIARPSESGKEELNAAATRLPAEADILIQQAINFIDDNLNERLLTVETIAAHLHFSPRHLSRLFRRGINMTVMEFVTRRRMELACQLLDESQFNIVKISAYCGYTSSTSFIKAFVRHMGSSPTAYRSTNRNDVRNGA